MTTNSLLDFSDLPRFDIFSPDHVTPAITQLLDEARAMVEKLEAPDASADWENFVQPLERVTERLGRAWGVVSHLNAVVDTPELRATYNENQPRVTEFWTELGQNLKLFEKYKALQASRGYHTLSPARRKITENAIRDFRLGGAELPEPQKKTIRRNSGTTSQALDPLFRECAGCDQCLRAAGGRWISPRGIA